MCIYIYRLSFFPRDSTFAFHHDQTKGWNQWVRIDITVYRAKKVSTNLNSTKRNTKKMYDMYFARIVFCK